MGGWSLNPGRMIEIQINGIINGSVGRQMGEGINPEVDVSKNG